MVAKFSLRFGVPDGMGGCGSSPKVAAGSPMTENLTYGFSSATGSL